jgi:hypothetical protein
MTIPPHIVAVKGVLPWRYVTITLKEILVVYHFEIIGH